MQKNLSRNRGKKLSKKGKVFARFGATLFLIGATLFWSLGLPLTFFIPRNAQAAVTEAPPGAMVGSTTSARAGGSFLPVLTFALTGSAGEKLNELKFTITGSTIPGVTGSAPAVNGDFGVAELFRDTNNDDQLNDTALGNATVTVGSLTTISIPGGHTLPTATNGTTEFYLKLNIASGAVDKHGFTIGLANGTANNPYVLDSGTVTSSAMVFGTVFQIDNTGPITTQNGIVNGSTGVGVDAFVFTGYNENLLTSSLTVGGSGSVRLQANDAQSNDSGFGGNPTGSNFCNSAFVDSSNSQFKVVCEHMSDGPGMTANTWHTFTITTAATDLAGNAVGSQYTTKFKTANFGGGNSNNPPPMISGTTPANGGMIPANGSLFFIFSTNMNTSSGDGKLFDLNNVQLFELRNGSEFSTNRFTTTTGWTFSSTRYEFKIPLTGVSLTVGSPYRARILADNNSNFADGSCGGSGERGCVMSFVNQAMPGPDYRLDFTLTANDTTAPSVTGSFPSDNATGVDRVIYNISETFNDGLDPITVNTGTVKLYCNSPNNNVSNCSTTDGFQNGLDPELTGTTVAMDRDGRTIYISPNQVLGVNGGAAENYFIRIVSGSSGVKDIAGNQLSSDIIRKFATSDLKNGQGASGYDNTAPSISSCNASNFEILATLNEAMLFDLSANATGASGAVNIHINHAPNWFLETSSDSGTTFNPVNLTQQGGAIAGGKAITYEPHTITAKITGLSLPPGTRYRLTISSAQDLGGSPGNAMGTNNKCEGTVANNQTNQGNMGPGGGGMENFNFFNAGTKPKMVMPFSNQAGKTTKYRAELFLTSAIPASGRIKLTYPTGFSFVSTCNTMPSEPMNNDINGPASGTPTFSSIACDSVSRIVTLTLGSTGLASGDMANFMYQGIVNSTSPKPPGSSGYSVDFKSYNAASTPVLLESASTMPFFIMEAGTLSISGAVYNDANSNKVKDGSEAGVSGIQVCYFGGFGGECTTSDGSGNYTFSNLGSGNYSVNIPPISSGTVTCTNSYQNVPITTASVTNINFPTQSVASSHILDVQITSNSTLANERVDVFAFKPFSNTTSTNEATGGFAVRECTLDSNGTCTNVQLPLSTGTWEVGVGPAMSKDPSSGYSMPDFKFMPPRPVQVIVGSGGVPDSCGGAGAPELCFALSTVTNQILGKAVDGSGVGINNAWVSAFPSTLDSTNSWAMPAQTNSTGNFTLKVNPGTYRVRVCSPGMPCSKEVQCTVANNSSNADNNTSADVTNADNNTSADVTCEGILIVNDVSGFSSASLSLSSVTSNDLVLKMAQGDSSISGTVLTSSGSSIAYAFVVGCEVDSTGAQIGACVDSPSDSSGNFTLYVSGGSTPRLWKLSAFTPEYGRVAGPTVTISAVNTTLSGQNITASGTFVTVSGTVFQDSDGDSALDSGEGKSSAFVNIYSSSYFNSTISGEAGAYSIKIPSGTGYTIECHIPGVGPCTPLTNQTLTSDTSGKNLMVAGLGTLKVYVCTLTTPSSAPSDSNGCASNQVTTAWVNAQQSNGRGNGTKNNATPGVYILTLPAGTYTVCANTPNTGSLGCQSNVTVTSGGTIHKNIAPPSFFTIAGTVSSASNACVGDVKVGFVNSTQGAYTVSKTSSSGVFTSSNVPAGTYKVHAFKKGCVLAAEQTVTVTTANVTGVALTMNASDATLVGRVTLDGSNYSAEAVVMATPSTGGKTLFAEVDNAQASTTNNNYDLALKSGVTYSVQAQGECLTSTRQTITSGTTTANFALTAVSGCTKKSPSPTNIVPSQGGIVKDTVSGVIANFPPGILGTETGTGTAIIDQTVGSSTNANNVIGGVAYEVTSTNDVGKSIETFSSSETSDAATITIPYTDADVSTANTSASNLLIASFDGSEWIADSGTTCDDTNNTCTANISHLSTYALVSPSSGGAPTTPTGLLATVASSSSITLTWTAVSGATSYDIYRSSSSTGTFSRLGSEPTVGAVTTYTDTGLSANTAYFYKISAINSSGESTASSAVNATTLTAGNRTTSQQTITSEDSTTSSTSTQTQSSTKTTSQTESTKPKETTPPPSTEAVNTIVTSETSATVTTKTKEAQLSVPAGTVSTPTTFTITPTTTLIPPKAGTRVIGAVGYNYSALAGTTKVTQFAKKVTITMNYKNTQIAGVDEKTLALHFWDEKKLAWVKVPGSKVNLNKNIVTAQVDHFTLYSLIGTETGIVPGDLIKIQTLNAVYYVGGDNKRYVFPNDKVYYTWYKDFSTVKTVSEDILASYQIGGNVTYRPGVRMIKMRSIPNTYAVSHSGVLKWISSEAVAKALYGSGWSTQIDDVSDAFFTNYKVGDDIEDASDFDPQVEMENSKTISEDKGL